MIYKAVKLSDQEIKLLWAKKEAKKIWEMTLGSDDDETPSSQHP